MSPYSISRKLFSICISLILLLSSCIKDSIMELGNIQGFETSPEVSVPLLKVHLGIKDIYDSYSSKAYIVEGSDKFVTFIYESDAFLSQKQFITIPTFNVDYNLSMNQSAINQFNSIGTYSNSYNNFVAINTNNKERVKLINVRDGDIFLSITSNFKHNGVIVVTYPSITKNGAHLTDTIHLVYTGTLPIIVTKLIDISGSDIDLTNNGVSYNIIPYNIDLSITRNPLNGVTLTDQVIINEQLNIQDYNYIQGYLGKFVALNHTTNQTLDIFEPHADGNIFIKDPKIRINIQNGLGIPMTALITNLNIVTGKGTNYPIVVNKFIDTFTVDYPTISQKGQIVNSTFLIDKTNSNIDSIFSHAPQRVQYDINFIANYNEDVTQNNFLLGNNSNIFNSNATTEMPLELKVYSYQLRSVDTINWPTTPEGVTIEKLKFTGWYQNAFPISNSVQLFFAKDSTILGVDSFYIVDSLYDRPIYIPGAIVDANGKLLQHSVVTNETIMLETKYNRLRKTTNRTVLVSTARTSDYNGAFPFVKIYSDQGLDFKLGIEAKGNYKKTF